MLPGSARLHYDYRYRATTGSNVDSLTEQIGAVGSADIANTGTNRPTVVDDSGVEAIQFDRSSAQYLLADPASNIFDVGDYLAWMWIGRLRSSVTNQQFGYFGRAAEKFDGMDRLHVGPDYEGFVVVPESNPNPALAFSDTSDYHVFCVEHTSSGMEARIDGTGVSAASSNTGMAAAGDRIVFGARNVDFDLHANCMFRELVFLVNATPAEVSNLESQMLARKP